MAAGQITSCSTWRLLTLQLLACVITRHVHAVVGTIQPRTSDVLTGGSTNLTCSMNRTDFNGSDSTCLAFFTDDNYKVPKEQIEIISDDSIILMIRNATLGIHKYTCMCHMHGIDYGYVYVGYPPTNVTNFRCRGYDFSNLSCNFTTPQNYIYTEYYLTFSTSTENYSYGCILQNGPTVLEKVCLITSTYYRVVYQYYNFTLQSNNSFGNLTQRFTIDQYSIIVPAKPDMKIDDISTNSVSLKISNITKWYHYAQYTSGLHYHIRLRPDKFDWIERNYTKRYPNFNFTIEIDGLEYAYRQYEVIVRVKTGIAALTETMWSEPFEDNFSTKAVRPDNPPEVDVGSFYIDPTGQTVRLYWKQLPEYRENGPEFKTVVTEVRQDGYLTNVTLIHIDNTSATYKWNSTSKYEFKIKSQNKEGHSKEASVIRVFPRPRHLRSEEKRHIRKVYHNQSYSISWQSEQPDSAELVNFTLFWCKSKMESQNQCMGTINFMHFDKYVYNYTTELQNHTLNFAVSANYRNYSTGMIWAMCTADLSTDLTKMYPEATPLSSRSIKIQWSTECLYKGILKQYNLIYCVVDNNASESSADCKNAEERRTLNNTDKEYIMENLDPFTKYKILISMSSKEKDGPISNPIFAMTTEDAPSSPTNLKYFNVTSKSAVLSWMPPAKNHGKLREYNVWVNNKKHTINVTANNSQERVIYKLEDLSSYTTYKVYVTAFTVKKSLPSNDVHLRTMIGYPSSPRNVNFTKINNTLVLNWTEPEFKSGPSQFYEIRINSIKNNKDDGCIIISGIQNKSHELKFPSCSDPNNAYTYAVRAVNAARCNEIDYEIKPDASSSCPRNQGAQRRRRHSKINSSVDSTYHNQNGHEKSAKVSTTKLTNDSEPPSILSTPSVHISDNNKCKDFIITNAPSEYNDSHQYELFHSEWETSSYLACVEAAKSELSLFAIFGVVLFLILLPLVYITNKEVKKMRSIGMELPEGLNETTPTTKGIAPCADIMQSDEPLYDKENHHLLSQIGSDSGFLNSGQCLDESSVHVCSDHHDSEKSSQSTDSVELTEVNSCSYTSSPSQSPKTNIHDTTVPHEETNVQPIIQAPPIQLRPTDNGYIKPMMMTNGYVQAQAFQKPREIAPFNGYTKLDDRGKPIFPSVAATGSIGIANPKVSSNKNIVPPQPMNGNICGYVTHKQLSDFGQHLQ